MFADLRSMLIRKFGDGHLELLTNRMLRLNDFNIGSLSSSPGGLLSSKSLNGACEVRTCQFSISVSIR